MLRFNLIFISSSIDVPNAVTRHEMKENKEERGEGKQLSGGY